MDLPNLATVICPNILYSKSVNVAKDDSFMGIECITELLERQDDYYRVPPDLLFVITENIFSIFTKELDLPPKEIHRHCQKYLQARMKGLPPSSSGPRISVHRSDGNLASSAEHKDPTAPPVSYRAAPSTGSRPASWVQPERLPSQQSLNTMSPGTTPWRGGNGSGSGAASGGPFQGHAHGHHSRENGSRNSSRGSMPGSPGPEGRISLSVEREGGRRTPVGDQR